MNRILSPERADPFAAKASAAGSGNSLVPNKRTYYDIMQEQQLDNEKADVYRKISQKQEDERRGEKAQQEQLKRQRTEDSTSTKHSGSVTIKSYAQPPP